MATPLGTLGNPPADQGHLFGARAACFRRAASAVVIGRGDPPDQFAFVRLAGDEGMGAESSAASAASRRLRRSPPRPYRARGKKSSGGQKSAGCRGRNRSPLGSCSAAADSAQAVWPISSSPGATNNEPARGSNLRSGARCIANLRRKTRGRAGSRKASGRGFISHSRQSGRPRQSHGIRF